MLNGFWIAASSGLIVCCDTSGTSDGCSLAFSDAATACCDATELFATELLLVASVLSCDCVEDAIAAPAAAGSHGD